MVDAVCEAYGIGGEQAKDYAAMLRGTAKTGDWHRYRIEGGITADEFRVWVAYYREVQMPGAILAKAPDQLNGYIMGWIAKGKPKPPSQANIIRQTTLFTVPTSQPLTEDERAASLKASQEARAKLKEGAS